MLPGVRELVPLVVMLVVILGPLLLLIGLLNLRDRRVAWLSGTAWAQFAPRLRSEVAIRVRAALLSRRCEVIVNTRGCVSEQEIWPVLMRVRRSLPAHARLTVEGGHGTDVAVELRGGRWSAPSSLLTQSTHQKLVAAATSRR